MVDRLTFNAHIVETGTESYRLRSTRTNRSTRTKDRAPRQATPAATDQEDQP